MANHRTPTDEPRAPRRTRRLLVPRAALAAIVFVSALLSTGDTAHGADATGTVVIVHGLQGIEADLYLDGASSPALTSFTFRRVTDPLSLQAGLHRADVRIARSPATSPPLLSGTFNVVAGQRVTVTALLDAGGRPSWLAFPNDAWTFMATDAQVRFRHLAATGPVTVVIDGAPALTGATNLAAATPTGPLELTPGVHQVAVLDTTSGAPLIAPQRIDVAGGSIVNLYLTGRAEPASLELLLQGASGEPAPTVAVAARVLPDTIDTGDSGLLSSAPESGSDPARLTASASIAVLAFAAGAVLLANRRRVPLLVRRSR